MLAWIRHKLNNWIINRYETQLLNVAHGVAQFYANFAFIQVSPLEYFWMPSPHKRLGDIHVSAKDSRPILTYKLWPEWDDWSEDLPVVECIVELRHLQVRFKSCQPKYVIPRANEWTLVPIEKINEDECTKYLVPLFQSFCFYRHLTAAHKKANEESN